VHREIKGNLKTVNLSGGKLNALQYFSIGRADVSRGCDLSFVEPGIVEPARARTQFTQWFWNGV
jgi:hypothetical protein